MKDDYTIWIEEPEDEEQEIKDLELNLDDLEEIIDFDN